MHPSHPNSRRRAASILALGALAVFGLGSCVTQQEYDDAVKEAKHWQKALYDLEQYQGELEAENRRLKDQLAVVDVGAVNAASTEDIDERLGHLDQIIAELGPEQGDVTKFRVDGGYVYRVKDSILFDTASTDISTSGRELLLEVAADITSRPHGKVLVRGHTDTVPIVKPATKERFPHGNLQLSAERAVVVAALLAESGKVAEDRVVVMGFGPNEPVESNATAEGRQKNRRVDIFVADE